MKCCKLYLYPKKEESVLRFHPWIFSGAISHSEGTPEEGDIVEIYDSQKRFLATGQCQVGSIAVRILSFKQEEINQSFWEEKLKNAWLLRKQLNLFKNDYSTIYRLVHGEGDGLPGLIIDIYENTAVMQAHSPGMHLVRHELAHALQQVMGNAIKNIFYKSDTTLPFKAGLEPENGYLYGGENVLSTALENGLRFHVDWVKGQKTGFFIDQRENRVLLEKYSSGRNVLNMFAYTGGFSCYAMRGNANIVHSVDSSSKAMHLTDQNIALNFPDDTRHSSFVTDAFKYLENMDEIYDLIVLDPPAFAKHRNVLKNALQGYRKLNTTAFRKIKPGGMLFTFSCSQAVSKENFRLAVFSAAAQSKRNVKIIHQLTQPADHPINIYHPEGEYIKGLVLSVE